MINKTVIMILVLIVTVGFATNSAFAHHVTKEIPVSTSPLKMSLTDDYLFVSNLGQNEISVIDTRTDKVAQTIPTENGVVAVQSVPEKNLVYASTFESGGIEVYDLNTKQHIQTIELPDAKLTMWYSPQREMQKYVRYVTGGVAMDYNPENGILFVANFNANYVATIDTNTNNVLQKIPVSQHPYALKVDHISGKVLVASMAGNEITFLKPNDDDTYSISSTVKTGIVPWGIAINSDEHRAYITHRGAHHITVLDIIDEKILTTIPVGDDTQAIALDSKEHQAYVSYLQQNKIVKIDTTKNEIVNTIETGDLSWDLAVDPTTHKLYASMQGQDKVFVMGPQSISMSIPIATMQTPIAVVGNLMIHGQDVTVTDATVDIDNKSLVLTTNTEDGGDITISIPREVLDAKQGDADAAFVAYVDSKPINIQDITSDEKTRVVSVQVPKNTETVTISGTNVIPEFGQITAMILIIGTISAILLLTKHKNLALLPKF